MAETSRLSQRVASTIGNRSCLRTPRGSRSRRTARETMIEFGSSRAREPGELGKHDPSSELTTDGASDYMPAWSPSGDALVFVSERSESRTSLYQLELSAEEPAPLPVELLAFEQPIASPSYSPDGTRIALRVLDIGTAGADAMREAPTASRLVLVPTAGVVDAGLAEDLEGPDDVFPFRAEWASATVLVYTAAGQLWRQDLAAPESAASAVPFEVSVTLDRPSYKRRKVEIRDGATARVRGLVRPVLARDGSKIAFAALGDVGPCLLRCLLRVGCLWRSLATSTSTAIRSGRPTHARSSTAPIAAARWTCGSKMLMGRSQTAADASRWIRARSFLPRGRPTEPASPMWMNVRGCTCCRSSPGRTKC